MKSSLQNLSDDELVSEFALTARRLGEAVVNWMPPVRYARRSIAIGAALRQRGQASRLKLAPLLDSDDRFARYYTAQELIGLLPHPCRLIIEENTREFDAIAGNARGFLHAIDDGTYKPD